MCITYIYIYIHIERERYSVFIYIYICLCILPQLLGVPLAHAARHGLRNAMRCLKPFTIGRYSSKISSRSLRD